MKLPRGIDGQGYKLGISKVFHFKERSGEAGAASAAPLSPQSWESPRPAPVLKGTRVSSPGGGPQDLRKSRALCGEMRLGHWSQGTERLS